MGFTVRVLISASMWCLLFAFLSDQVYLLFSGFLVFLSRVVLFAVWNKSNENEQEHGKQACDVARSTMYAILDEYVIYAYLFYYLHSPYSILNTSALSNFATIHKSKHQACRQLNKLLHPSLRLRSLSPSHKTRQIRNPLLGTSLGRPLARRLIPHRLTAAPHGRVEEECKVSGQGTNPHQGKHLDTNVGPDIELVLGREGNLGGDADDSGDDGGDGENKAR